MRDLYKVLSAIGDILTVFNKGFGGLAKRRVNQKVHKEIAKGMRKFWG